MAITFVDHQETVAGNSTSRVFDWGGIVGEADNDIAIVVIYRETTATITPPAGWTLIDVSLPVQQATGGFKYEVTAYWHRRSGAETTHTWSWTGSAWSQLIASVFRGCTTSATPILTVSIDMETAQNNEPVNPGLVVAQATSALFFATTNFAGTGIDTNPTGFTPTFVGGDNLISWYNLTTAAGATGNVSGDLGDPEYAGSILIELGAVAPAAAVTGTATASITEADVVAGGKTIITTLTDDTFIADTVPTAAFASGTAATTTAAPGRTSTGDIVATFPTTPTVGQFGIIICYLDAGTASITAGWTLVTGAPWGSATPKLYIWTRVMLTGDTAPTITIAGAGALDASVVNVAFYNGIGSVVTIGAATSSTGTPSTAAQITGAAVGNIIVGIIARGDNENASGQTFGGSGTGVAERLDAGTDQGNDAQISMADKTLTATGATGNLSVTTAATDPYIGIILELAVATNSPFKVAAVNLWAPLLDSAQAEANGWDARVKPALVAANFVRTSATVATITLPAVGTYDITAQETITDTVPAGILTGGANIVATPTFTVDQTGATGQPARKRMGGVQFASASQSGSVGTW